MARVSCRLKRQFSKNWGGGLPWEKTPLIPVKYGTWRSFRRLKKSRSRKGELERNSRVLKGKRGRQPKARSRETTKEKRRLRTLRGKNLTGLFGQLCQKRKKKRSFLQEGENA